MLLKPKDKKKKKKVNYKKKCDLLWGQIIHKSNACAIGGDCAGRLEAHHLISRSRTPTRHKIENGILLCSKHHKFSTECSPHAGPLGFAEWMINHKPHIYNWVQAHKNDIGKPDYEEIYKDLKQIAGIL
jgi:hypothetical protein